MKPLWRAGVFSPWTHGPLPSPIQKAPFLRPAQGWSRVWVRSYFGSRCFCLKAGELGIPQLAGSRLRAETFAAQTLAPGFGQGAARFGAKKYGPPISGQAWGAIFPPGRQSCWSARSR